MTGIASTDKLVAPQTMVGGVLYRYDHQRLRGAVAMQSKSVRFGQQGPMHSP